MIKLEKSQLRPGRLYKLSYIGKIIDAYFLGFDTRSGFDNYQIRVKDEDLNFGCNFETPMEVYYAKNSAIINKLIFADDIGYKYASIDIRSDIFFFV